MTTEEMGALRANRDALADKLNKIKAQLLGARLGEEEADRDWYRRARIAEKITGRQFNAASELLGRAERELRRDRNDSRERAFVAVAKRVLAEETYSAIWAEVEGKE
jgi:hypothetical protein